MKHLKRFNESKEDEKLDILENFAYITDKFGQPSINSSNYGTGTKWNISWDIKLNLSVLQEATQLIQKLKDIVEEITNSGANIERFVRTASNPISITITISGAKKTEIDAAFNSLVFEHATTVSTKAI